MLRQGHGGENIDHGIENAPAAFLKLFKGESFGKMLVEPG
jgi:NADPH-dependent curcumin reductase CurA